MEEINISKGIGLGKYLKRLSAGLGAIILSSILLYNVSNSFPEYREFKEKKRELNASYNTEASSLTGNFELEMSELDKKYQTQLGLLKTEKKIKRLERKVRESD